MTISLLTNSTIYTHGLIRYKHTIIHVVILPVLSSMWTRRIVKLFKNKSAWTPSSVAKHPVAIGWGVNNTFNFFPVGFEDVARTGAGVDNIKWAICRGSDIGVRSITQGSNQSSTIICTIIDVYTTWTTCNLKEIKINKSLLSRSRANLQQIHPKSIWYQTLVLF